MRTSISLDDELQAAVDDAASLIRQNTATVLRMAIRAGLPLVTSRFQENRPPGYFGEDYPLPDEWIALEQAMAEAPQPEP